MNTSEDIHLNGTFAEEDSTNISHLPISDSNANLNNQSKGAIPKTRNIAIMKKAAKLNNNVDDMVTHNGLTDPINECDKTEAIKSNSFINSRLLRTGNYREEYSKILCEDIDFHYRNLSLNCESDSLDKRELFKVESTENHNGCCTISSSYQPVASCSRENNEVVFDVESPQIETDSSSSEDNELLSISDDGCIYTYKGDQVADLPSSFFSLEANFPPPPVNQTPPPQDREGSPEMDFLEMDFDPGPSGDGDSDSQSNADLEGAECLPCDSNVLPDSVDCNNLNSNSTVNNKANRNFDENVEMNSNFINRVSEIPTSSDANLNRDPQSEVKTTCEALTITEKLLEFKMPWSRHIKERTIGIPRRKLTISRVHSPSGEALPFDEKLQIIQEKNIKSKSSYAKSNKEFMIWTEEEAMKQQIIQIGASACGATAVLNVLKALRFPLPSLDELKEAVTTRLRAGVSSSLTDYLISRSTAGSTHMDLINGLHKLSNEQVYARFFHMFPERNLNLNYWLHFWMSHGAVPIATLNLQKGMDSPIPDAWHHQMIYGVDSEGVYLVNPLEYVKSECIWSQLCSASILLVREDDVLVRWNAKFDIKQLMKINDKTWDKLNVIGQVARLVRESRKESSSNITNYLKIPASYSSGITLVIRRDSPFFPFLLFCPELPILPAEVAHGLCDFEN